MSQNLASGLINRLRVRAGREPDAAPDLPLGLAIHLVRHKGLALIRGYLRTRGRVFLDPQVRLRGKSGIAFGRGVSIGRGTVIDGYASEGVRLGPASRMGSYYVVRCTIHVYRVDAGVNP